jgi:hypothetical protein
MSAAALANIPKSAYELGDLIEDFPVDRQELWFNLLCIPPLLGLASWMVYARVPNLLAPQSSIEFLTLAGGCVFVLGGISWGVATIAKSYRNREMRVLAFEEGFVSFRPDGVFACRWDEIDWTCEGLYDRPMAQVQVLTVQCHSGQVWRLSRDTEMVKNFPRLIELIERKVAEQLLPGARDQLRDGETLDFGQLKLSSEGFIHGSRLLRWADVDAIHEEQFRVTVEQSGSYLTWAAIATGSLTNKRLMLELARELGTTVTWDIVRT